MSHLALPAHLLRVYEESVYEVYGAPPAAFTLADAAGAHDAWLAALRVHAAAVVTAWNPFSEPATPADNAAAQARLRAAIAESGLVALAARGRHPLDAWHEDSFCVLGVQPAEVVGWLATFCQNAALYVERGASPRLLWHPRFAGSSPLRG
jgi:hypothetical protein